MWDIVLAAAGLASLAAFVGVLIWYIGEIDLVIITITVLIMAAVDFYLLTIRSSSSDPPPTDLTEGA